MTGDVTPLLTLEERRRSRDSGSGLPPDTVRVDVIACDALADRASVREFELQSAKR